MEEGQSLSANTKYHFQTLAPLLFWDLGFGDCLSLKGKMLFAQLPKSYKWKEILGLVIILVALVLYINRSTQVKKLFHLECGILIFDEFLVFE